MSAVTEGLDYASRSYRDAYSRINGLVVVGEGLADRHFRLLARAIPEDRGELERLGAMEGCHARAFSGCGRHLGVTPDLQLAKRLFAPLHQLFLACDRAADLAGCLVIQGLVVECFAVAAYRHYLPVADSYAQPITAAVLQDEAAHLHYAEAWLLAHLATVQPAVTAICRRALPMALRILQALSGDMRAIGIDPLDLIVSFQALFQQSLETIGYEPGQARRLILRAVVSQPMS